MEDTYSILHPYHYHKYSEIVNKYQVITGYNIKYIRISISNYFNNSDNQHTTVIDHRKTSNR